jgi:uncharacterized protein (UPF0332 family)
VELALAYHDDLLAQAFTLVHKERTNPKQASLRRAISTAYYALFHLLISEASENWKRVNLRPALARAFDHGLRKAASNRVQNIQKFPFTREDPKVASALRSVAKIFAQLQGERHTADYDNTTFWTRSEALTHAEVAERAFAAWRSVRNQQIAQEYLVSLLVRKRD